MFWSQLDLYWKEVFRLSWESYRNGSIPIGAVIINDDGKIVAHGRNVSYDAESGHVLSGIAMGHVEMVALMQLKKIDHPNIRKYKLFVSLEPCPMCFGAVMMMGMKDVYYAATDGSAGSSVMHDITEYIESRSVRVVKDSGNLEIFQIVLQTARGRFNPIKKIMDNWEKEHPGIIKLGNELHDENYFSRAAEKNTGISIIYNYVINRYNQQRRI